MFRNAPARKSTSVATPAELDHFFDFRTYAKLYVFVPFFILRLGSFLSASNFGMAAILYYF
jgi:hypothetical protein